MDHHQHQDHISDTTASAHNHQMDMHNDSMMMKMWFHFGYNEHAVLFDFWTIHSIGALIGSVVICGLMSFAYETIKFLRLWLMSRQRSASDSIDAPLISSTSKRWIRSRFTLSNLTLSCVYAIQVILGMFLMLIFMTYNVWLCLGVLVGAFIGNICYDGCCKGVVGHGTDTCH